MVKFETDLLKSWQLKIAILVSIVTPAITATGAFYGLKTEIASREAKVNERISAIELQTEKTFADKESLKEIRHDIKQMQADVIEIKTILTKKSR